MLLGVLLSGMPEPVIMAEPSITSPCTASLNRARIVAQHISRSKWKRY
jgi:hypothetical protein